VYVNGTNDVDLTLAIEVADRTYGSITFTTKVLRRGRPAVTVIQYILGQVKLQEKPPQEITYLDTIINNSLGFLSDIQRKGDLLLEKLLLVKVAYFSETVGRTQTSIAPGRGDKFTDYLRVKMEDGNSPVAYAQVRGIFKTVYSQKDDRSDLVFLVR